MNPHIPRVLTDGTALIVPLFGSPQSLPEKIVQAREAGADVVEWRADLSEDWESCAAVLADADVPVIATLRTDREGGAFAGRGEDYLTAVTMLLAAKPDLIDVEINRSAAYRAIALARSSGVPVIASHHNFDMTPRNDDILEILQAMVEADADILKIAFQPLTPDDTWRHMELSRSLTGRFGRPIISISMGDDAAWTRLAAKACGSAATFASLGEGSAPGQIDASLVRGVLDALGR